MTALQTVEAAVGILRRADGQVLLTQRPAGKPWAGWWEFPGGKIEQGESPLQALTRELHEEIGIAVQTAYPWLTRSFDYPEKRVILHFYIVREWLNEAQGCEQQLLSWQFPAELTVEPMLPANAPILDALCLADTYAISNLHELGEAAFFQSLQLALDSGLKLIQVREKQLTGEALANFSRKVIAMARPYAAKVLLNADAELANQLGADGVHFTSAQLMHLSEKPTDLICGASCHNAAELAQASRLEMDYVMLSPVLATASHADAIPLGWPAFAQLLRHYPLPVYALGGMQPEDMLTAWQHGAHGIAMQRAAWPLNHG